VTFDLANVLGPLDGAQIPGGCDWCNAYQTVRAETAGFWHITTHHDDWCPWLAASEARRPKRQRKKTRDPRHQ
jgi:hypothetical protein